MNVMTTSLPAGSDFPETAAPSIQVDASEPSLVRQYLRIAERWKWVLGGILGACLLFGMVATFLMTPQYTATTTLEISRDSDKVTDFQGVQRETSVADQEFYQTQYGLLAARTLAERVAAELGLAEDPAFFALYEVGDTNPAFRMTNGRYPASGAAERARRAAGILLGNIQIAPTRLSRLVDVRYESPDPAFSARVANAWAENFIKSNLARKVQATSYGREQLQRQLAEYKNRLDKSQRQLVDYASSEGIINLPAQPVGDGTTTQERSIVADDLARLNSALADATAARIQAEARARANGRLSGEALANPAINALRQSRAELSAEYQQLLVRFEPGYPAAQALKSRIDELDSAISREESRVSGALTADYRAALARENALQAQVNRLKGSYLDLRRRSIEYNIYQQEVDTNRALYDGLLQRFKEIGVAGGVGVNNIAIIDRAQVPENPSSPNLLINLLIAGFIGACMGIAVVLLLEQMDEAISDPADVTRRLGLPMLGSIPLVPDIEPVEALRDRKSELVDAYLAIFTNLGFTTQHGVPRTLAVTSTRPAEGKSTTSLAIATMLARSAKKTILIDGDLRSPSIHQLADEENKRGLSNFLSGDDDLASLVIDLPEMGISIMPAGPLPPNAAELLTGDRLSLLLERLLEKFDHVVLDSPPVLGLADAPMITSATEGTVFAIEANSVRSTVAKNAIARLASGKARILGVVLTKFDARKSDYGYEYGYSYGRSEA